MPPVWPSPRPLIFPNGTPQAATTGPTAIDVLSPTPPVECLSTTLRPERACEVDRLAALDHRVGERERLGAGEPAEVDRHAERGQLVVRDLAARVAEHELADLVGRELLAVALPLDQLGGADHGSGDEDRHPPRRDERSVERRHGSAVLPRDPSDST